MILDFHKSFCSPHLFPRFAFDTPMNQSETESGVGLKFKSGSVTKII